MAWVKRCFYRCCAVVACHVEQPVVCFFFFLKLKLPLMTMSDLKFLEIRGVVFEAAFNSVIICFEGI